MNELKVVKITHRKAPVAIREKFYLNQEERTHLYFQLRDYFDIKESLIVSTCNRTEIYYVREEDLSEKIIGLLGSFKGIDEGFREQFVSITNGHEALRHLFKMAIGVDSQVLGDIQIFGQVKQAYQEATDHNMAQTLLHRAMHSLFYTHKQVCQETNFKDGAASASYNAVKLLKERNLINTTSKILVAGAGKMGSDVCRNLVKLGYGNITIANRTLQKAELIGEELSLQVLPLGSLKEELGKYDILVSTIGTSYFEHANFNSNAFKIVCLDLSTPRSLSPDFIKRYASSYYDIDQIGNISATIIAQRKKYIPEVLKIIDQCLSEFDQWVKSYHQTAEIRRFKETLDQLRKASISSYLKKVDSDQAELIEQVSKSIIQQIVKLPAVQLRQACERERADQLSQTLNELFNLEYQSISKSKEKRL